MYISVSEIFAIAPYFFLLSQNSFTECQTVILPAESDPGSDNLSSIFQFFRKPMKIMQMAPDKTLVLKFANFSVMDLDTETVTLLQHSFEILKEALQKSLPAV